MDQLAGLLVVAFGIFLIGLAGISAFAPRRAREFLESFASSAKAHYTELAIRCLVGLSLVHFAPSMWFSQLFGIFGWTLLITTAGLLLIPWQWHHEIAKRAIRLPLSQLWLFALGAAALAAFVLYGASRALPG